MRTKGEKIVISQRSMNRMFYGTHTPWNVLRGEGAILLAEETRSDDEGSSRTTVVRLDGNVQPKGRVVGVVLAGEEFMSSWVPMKFIKSPALADEPARVKAVKIPGLPEIICHARQH